MRGRDCTNFRKDRCGAEKCPNFLYCPIQNTNPLPAGTKPEDYLDED